ncbi:DUF1569 domain-containing protein [Chitinophaga sp. YIM B06452]|uniref:DUF1569 domain-containing protein n=1 Tax=Chitinophaga sp. YIM B06452 TaxID=3082158 RepID=UPI0031FE48C8
MALPDIFSRSVSDQVIGRINRLTPATAPQWGKMNVGQMLAHVNVAYEMVYDDKYPKPGFFMGIILKTFVKKVVCGEAPYKKNNPTAPAFLITGERDFEREKLRLIDYINKTQLLGSQAFDNRKSLSFGKLSIPEWNNMFYKHLDHHLTQFGV